MQNAITTGALPDPHQTEGHRMPYLYLYDAGNAVGELISLHEGGTQVEMSRGNADAHLDLTEPHTDKATDELVSSFLLPEEGGTQHDPDQTDAHHGASQADRSMENADGTLTNPHQTDNHGTHPVETPVAQCDIKEYRRRLLPGEGVTQHDPDQTDGHHGASQADRSIENVDGTLTNPHQTGGHGTQPVETAVALCDIMDYRRRLLPGEGGTQHDPDQTDRYQGPSQADRLMENVDVPSIDGTLLDPHETDGYGTQPVEISRGHAATQSSSVSKLRSEEWKEFKIIESTLEGSPVRAKCIHCDAELRCPTFQGLGVISRHLRTKTCLSKKFGGSDPLCTFSATTNPATGNSSSRKRRKPSTNRMKKDDFSKEKHDILGADPNEQPCDSDNPRDKCYLIDQLAQRGIGTLLDRHETDGHGTQPVEILRGHAATQSRSVSRLRAEEWKEFKIIESTLTGSPVRAKCIHCDAKLRCPTKHGSGVLSRHLETKTCLSKRFGGSDPLRTAGATTNPATGNSFSRKRKAHTNRRKKDDFSKEILHDIPGGKQLRR